MQNENIENTYAYQACQSILAGDQKAAIDYAKKAFPSLLDDPETYCLTTVELLDLAQDHHLDISLALNGGFRTGIYLGAQSALVVSQFKANGYIGMINDSMRYCLLIEVKPCLLLNTKSL